jgi:excisionase family DNA binding protein
MLRWGLHLFLHFVSGERITNNLIVREKLEKMTEMEDRWLSISEICKYLGVSNDTVYKWIDKHDMPAHRMGRLWKFKKEQVDAWVEDGGAAEHTKRNPAQE